MPYERDAMRKNCPFLSANSMKKSRHDSHEINWLLIIKIAEKKHHIAPMNSSAGHQRATGK
ncbi:MAG: hypothetical protein ACLT0Y_05060, partial [Christensenellales bacterium]